jgi:hypothetical protein
MQILAEVVERKEVNVTIDPTNVVRQLMYKWRSTIPDIMRSWRIEDGTWIDPNFRGTSPRGEDFYEPLKIRTATEAELEMQTSFNAIINFTRRNI